MEIKDFIYNDLQEKKLKIDDNNFNKIIQHIDELDLNTLTSNNEITLVVAPFETELKDQEYEKSCADWAKLLNKITNKGYTVKIKIICYGLSVNNTRESNDVLSKILHCKNDIKNKENINICYALPPEHYTNLQIINDIENILDLCAKDIEEKNFSPLEKLIAAYKVTVGLFQKNNNDYSDIQSHDIYSSIMMYPNVTPMCQVYSLVLEELCKRLNIKCFNKTITANSYHSTDIVEIKDDKYNIEGRYFIDATLAATCVNYFVNDMMAEGKELEDNLPVASELFCIGNEGLEDWAKYYQIVQPEFWHTMKLSDKNIPDSTLYEAAKIVNDAFFINKKQTSQR